MNKHIPVFLASNDLYAPFITTTIASIMDHTKSFVDFYILTDGISRENKRKIETLRQVYSNWSIEYLYVDTEKYLKDFPYIFDYSFASYNRYLIPMLKPDLNKIIYSDVDVIYCDDIQKMYDIDMEGKGLAAPIEELGLELPGDFNHSVRKKRLNIKSDHLFFQSGNLIMDCDYWRKNKIMEKCFELTLKHKNILLCPDLEVLNILFEGQYKMLPYRFSMCTHRICPEETNEEMLEAEKNPFCIHYASSKKPWNVKNVPYADIFWKYARQTAFYEDILHWYCEETIMTELTKNTNYDTLYKKYQRQKILSLITFGDTRKKHIEKKQRLKKEVNKIKRRLNK